MESYVKLSTEKYEELAKKGLMLDMLAFGAPEENAADTENGKC